MVWLKYANKKRKNLFRRRCDTIQKSATPTAATTTLTETATATTTTLKQQH